MDAVAAAARYLALSTPFSVDVVTGISFHVLKLARAAEDPKLLLVRGTAVDGAGNSCCVCVSHS